MVFRIAFMMLRDVVAQHAVLFVILAAIVLALLMPGVAKSVFTFMTRTLPGQIITACLVAAVLAWCARGYVDDAANRTQAIVAARAETAREAALAKASEARLAALRDQVAAGNDLLREANERAATNEAAVISYQQREADYEAALDQADAATPAARSCALDDADVRGLRRAAAVYRPVVASGASRAARHLRPARRGP